MDKRYSYLFKNTRYERYKENKKDSFNSSSSELLNNSFLLKKNLMVLGSILFLESSSFELFFLFESSPVNLIIIINFSRAFIFL